MNDKSTVKFILLCILIFKIFGQQSEYKFLHAESALNFVPQCAGLYKSHALTAICTLSQPNKEAKTNKWRQCGL